MGILITGCQPTQPTPRKNGGIPSGFHLLSKHGSGQVEMTIVSIGFDLNSLKPLVPNFDGVKADTKTEDVMPTFPTQLSYMYESCLKKMEASLMAHPAIHYYDIDVIRDNRYYIAHSDPNVPARFVQPPYKPVSRRLSEMGYMTKGLGLDVVLWVDLSLVYPKVPDKQVPKEHQKDGMPIQLQGQVVAVSAQGQQVFAEGVISQIVWIDHSKANADKLTASQLRSMATLFDAYNAAFDMALSRLIKSSPDTPKDLKKQ